jgi:hypothetical protein
MHPLVFFQVEELLFFSFGIPYFPYLKVYTIKKYSSILVVPMQSRYRHKSRTHAIKLWKLWPWPPLLIPKVLYVSRRDDSVADLLLVRYSHAITNNLINFVVTLETKQHIYYSIQHSYYRKTVMPPSRSARLPSPRACLDAIQIPNFFTLSPSHQFLTACMEY